MSRSAERPRHRQGPRDRPRGRVRTGVIGVALALALAGLAVPTTLVVPIPLVLTAAAEPGDVPPVLDVDARTATVIAPVLDVVVTTGDTDGVATVREGLDRIRVTLDATVTFEQDGDAIRPAASPRLDDVASRLATRSPGRVSIVGYTDDQGSDRDALDLSRRRAEAVAAALRRALPESLYPFTVIGRGKADPVVPNTSEANRGRNQRVVISYPAG